MLFLVMVRRKPLSTLFPYTTLFRSVSVRSGAKFSMPGMMDTILNLGLNDAAVDGLKRRTKNGRFAFDSYRRLDRKSTRLNSSHRTISYAVFCLKQKKYLYLTSCLDT